MARTCQYHDGGRYVHPQEAATHVAIRRLHDGHWDIYEAVSRGSQHTPEFCRRHSMDVATDRNDRQQHAREGREVPPPDGRRRAKETP
jgi:hypothetical protein